MVLMVERNRREHLIRRFAGRGNEPDPCDVKIASLKQRIQELEFLQLQQDSPAEEAETESNVWDDGSEDVNPFWRRKPWEEEYHFVNKYPSFQEEPIVLVEEKSCPVYDTDNEEEESMPIYDTDIEDVIAEEEGFVWKGGFGGEEDNIEDVDSPAEVAVTESNVWDDGSEDVNPFGGGNPGFHDDHYDNPLLTKETESEPIIWDIGDEEEEYPFVIKYSSFQEEPIVLVEDKSCPVYDTDNEEE
ncbi:hypothetical protein Tco_0027409 [Tanacetum coccineum]